MNMIKKLQGLRLVLLQGWGHRGGRGCADGRGSAGTPNTQLTSCPAGAWCPAMGRVRVVPGHQQRCSVRLRKEEEWVALSPAHGQHGEGPKPLAGRLCTSG